MLLAKRQILVKEGGEAIAFTVRMMLCSSLGGDHSSNHHNTLLVLDGITCKARPLEARKPWFV